MADINVNLRTYNEETEINDRLLPRTLAENVIESEEKQFISAELKAKIDQKQDLLGYTPVNKAEDTMTGALLLLGNVFNTDNQVITKKYVDDKIKELVNSSPDVLDTLYELAAAINNDPNFAVTITNFLSLKLNKDQVSVTAEPNKILYLNGEGELPANIKGNAATATKFAAPININLTGHLNTTVTFDGSSDVTVPANLPYASSTTSGIITTEDYQKLSGMSEEITGTVGAFKLDIHTSDFIDDTKYNSKKAALIVETERPIAFAKTYEVSGADSSEILTQIEIIPDSASGTQTVNVYSIKPFNGKLVYSLLT